MQEIQQLLGEKDLTIFQLQKQIEILKYALKEAKGQLCEIEETPHTLTPLPQNN